MPELWMIVAGLFALGMLVGVPIMAIVAYARSGHIVELASRLERLETYVRQLAPPAPQSGTSEQMPSNELVEAVEVVVPESAPGDIRPPVMPARAIQARPGPQATSASREAWSWELFIGRKALGWMAVVVLLFGTAFFLRYAFENQWIGPVGRVALGIAGGLALVIAGRRYLRQGWRTLAQMLIAGGVVLLYLSTYSAFAFYHLVPQGAASLFLFLIVAESMLLALRCESPAIALMAVIGGLLTPLLMHAEHDQYISLFLYLGVLNAGVVGLLMLRSWPVVGSVALAGTQALFWAWHAENFHPEKLAWSIGFQAVLFGLYFVQSLLVGLYAGRRATLEELARFLAVAVCWCAAGYFLLDEDYHDWLGSLAVLMAAVYALATRILLAPAQPDERLMIASLAVSAGFVALAFPLQADAPWVALGWAAEAGVLWWFGLRVNSSRLRALAGLFAAMSIVGMVMLDTPRYMRSPFIPVFNRYALPALLAVACLSLALAGTRRFAARLLSEERVLVAITAVACVLLVWWIISVDISGYFTAQGAQHAAAYGGQRMAQMALSTWWAIYASIILALGFRTRLSLLRWTALGLFAITVAKVFLRDMEGLDEIYRIVAFFVLALLLGAAAWTYQRNQPDRS